MKTEDELRKIKARLRALNEKTTANGCTEDEAIAAANKATEILSKHGLTEADLAEDFETSWRGISRRSPLENIWFATAKFADCKGWYTRDMRGSLAITFFGRASDVLVAEYVHDVLAAATKRATREFRASELYQKRRTPRTRAQALRAFQEGFAASVVRKLFDGLWRRYGERANEKIKETARLLTVASQDHGFVFGNPARDLARARGAFRDHARSDGFQAGQKVDVNAPVPGSSKHVAGLLQ